MVLDKEGKSICDRVRDAKRQKRLDQPITIGKEFYSDLKDEFFGDLDLTQDFEKPPESDQTDERLFGCLRSVLQHNRNFVPVQTYMQEVGLAGPLDSSSQGPARRQEPRLGELLARCHGVHRRR